MTKFFAILTLLAAVSNFASADIFLRNRTLTNQEIAEQSNSTLTKDQGSTPSGNEHFALWHFSTPLTESLKQTLADQGVRILRYVPNNAYWVATPSAFTSQDLSLISADITEVAIDSPDRLAPGVGANKSAKKQRVWVTTFTAEAGFELSKQVESYRDTQLISYSDRDLMIETSTEQLGRLAQQASIEWIEEIPVFLPLDYIINPADLPTQPNANGKDDTTTPPALTGFESGNRIIGLEAAWKRGYTGKGETAGIADTGVDKGSITDIHEDLKGTVKGGYAVGMWGKSWEDSQGHGTHVAGSIVGNGTQSQGMIKGGAYEANFIAEGMWSPVLNNLAPPSDFEKVFGPAIKDGVRVHSNSWGAAQGFGEYEASAQRLDEYLWNHPNVLLLFAAGNSGQDLDKDGRIDENSIGPPSTAKNVLTVGASENLLSEGGIQKKLVELKPGPQLWSAEPIASDRLSDNINGIAAFSSRGPTKDGRIKPEIVAPGTNIVSLRSRHPKATLLWGAYNDHYAYAGGTSMATPITAGAATVIRQYLRAEQKQADPSGALLKAYMIHTATDLYPGQYGTGPKQELQKVRPNVHEGWGRVNADYATSIGHVVLADEKDGLTDGTSKEYSLELSRSGAIRVTLSYFDYPATPSAAKALVNDLDVTLTAPNGKVWTLNDHLNPTEMIEASSLSAGVYKVKVTATKVAMGSKQPFGLVISGE